MMIRLFKSEIPLSAAIGISLILFYLATAILGPLFAPYGQSEIVGNVWEEAGGEFLLGTDNLGRDMLSRLIYGTRVTIFIALSATIISFSVGICGGLFAAIHRGRTDQFLSRGVDLMMALPTLIFALVVLSVLPANLVTLILVMAFLDCSRVFRVSRSVAMDIVVMEYIEAARLRGEKTPWLLAREILPNAAPPLIAEFGLRFSFAVLFLSSLSFLGLGVQPPAADWGGMVKENKDGIAFGLAAPLMPATAIAVLTVSVNLVVDWMLNRAARLRANE